VAVFRRRASPKVFCCESEDQRDNSNLSSLRGEIMFGQFLDPTDIELLQRALTARLAHLNVLPESPEAQMIASQLI